MSTRSRPWTPGTPCWIDLATTDAAGARDFYGALFGWDFAVMGPEFGDYALARLGAGHAAGLGPVMDPSQPTAWTLYFATTDAAATAAAVTEAGGTVLAGPMEVPGSGTMLVITDPTGARMGAWQPGPFIGAEVVNQPGALCWEDLRSPDPAASRAFLTKVFGYTHDSFPDAPEDYTTLQLDEPYPMGGVGPMFGSAIPQWLPYFGVADITEAVATVTASGGSVVSGPDETPFGKMATITDPQGASLMIMENTGQPQPDRA